MGQYNERIAALYIHRRTIELFLLHSIPRLEHRHLLLQFLLLALQFLSSLGHAAAAAAAVRSIIRAVVTTAATLEFLDRPPFILQ